MGSIRLLIRLVVLGSLGGLGALAYYGFTLPVPRLLDPPAQPAVILETADGAVFAGRGVLTGRRLSVADLPGHLIDAVIAIEDRRFRDHEGIDPRGILRALSENLRAGGIRQGGSTITQQLAKVMFLGPERTLARKVQEAMIAVWLEGRLSKDEILSLYLDRVYFGAGAYGVVAAARRYFDKSASALTLSESALLAGLIRAPSRLAPTRNPAAAWHRAEIVLRAMVETGALAETDSAVAPARLAPAAATDPG
ncbi:MAG: biosynthetic peptidoglycan transglycosylase, partial [Alphaproteobacteria bacterium]